MYLSKFLIATDQTKTLGLLCPNIKQQPQSRLDDYLANLFQKSIKLVSPQQFLGNCQIASRVVLDVILNGSNMGAYITIGDVVNKGKHMYGVGRSTFEAIINGTTTETQNITKLHTWITLDSMEIIDFTLLTFTGEAPGQPLVGNPDEFSANGLDYIPQVVGDELFSKHMPLYDVLVKNLANQILR